ncbi:hypothetical protein UFO1_1448 [Pelosinus sp. UFO1]|nr:hypothetical protein UFO1_1448 [Pelosinus sp. UFO1]
MGNFIDVFYVRLDFDLGDIFLGGVVLLHENI